MYLYGGYSGNERLADMYAYDFANNHWSEVDCTNGDAPSGRSSLVAQVHENCLYIFGGYNGVTVLNDFYKFRLKPVCIPPSALVKDLSKMINNVELSDVTFLVEGKEVHCNRAIMAVRSEFFRVMLFSGGMRESNTPSTPIELVEISHSVFLKVLEFLYTDTVRDVTLEMGVLLLIASERFMLDRLKGLCEDIIRRDVNETNAIGILVASHQYRAICLKNIAMEFILTHLTEPSIMLGLSELRTEPDLLLEIIQRNASSASSPSPGDEVSAPSGPFGNGSDWKTRR